jgi:hypothetical protein
VAAQSQFRELQYRLTLRAGAEPTAIPLHLARGAPTLRAETAVTHLDETGHVWRILDVHGSEEEIRRSRAAFLAYQPPFLLEKRVMGETRRHLVLWVKYRRALGSGATSLTALAFHILGRETVITDAARQGELTVRILARAGNALNRYLQRVRKEAEATYEFQLLYLGPPRERTLARLSAEEEGVLQAGQRLGYFGVPRKAGVREIGNELGISASAVSYRLRTAESKLVLAHLGGR